MSTSTKPDFVAGLVPVPKGEGLTLESRVERSWVVKDSHHPVVEAEATPGTNLLAVNMGGIEFRISHTQWQALKLIGADWERHWE
jgi:hypothetical protein